MSANAGERQDGGEGGIRTPDTVTRMPHFECGAFNHSATSPSYSSCCIFKLMAELENGWIATALLPIGFEASVYSGAHRQVNAIGRLGLQTRQDMAVEIDRNRHAGMAETLLGHFRVDAGGQQVGGVAVAQIVQSHSWQAALSKEDLECMRDAARLQWLAIRTHHDVMIVR